MARKWRLLILRVQFFLLRTVRAYRNNQQTRRRGDARTGRSLISRRALLFILSALFGFTSALSLPALSAYQIAQEPQTTSQNSEAMELVEEALKFSKDSEFGKAEEKWLEAAQSFLKGEKCEPENMLKSLTERAEALRILGFDRMAFNTLVDGLELHAKDCTERKKLIQRQPNYLRQSDFPKKEDFKDRIEEVVQERPSSATEAQALQSLGKVLRELGEFDESVKVLKKSLQYAQTHSSLDEGSIFLDIGNTQVSAGRKKVNEQESPEELIRKLAKEEAEYKEEKVNELTDILTYIQECQADKNNATEECNNTIGGGYYQLAIDSYEEAKKSVIFATEIKAQLNQLSLLIDIQKNLEKAINKAKEIEPREQTKEKVISTYVEWEDSIKPELDEKLQNLIYEIDQKVSYRIDPEAPLSKSNIDFFLKFTDILAKNINLQTGEGKTFSSLNLLINLEQIFAKDSNYSEKLKSIDPRSQAFFLGNLGKISEQEKAYGKANIYTRAALEITDKQGQEGKREPYINYILNWQLGRILKKQGELSEAKLYYKKAFNNLKILRKDIIQNSKNLQFDFKEEFEPVYRDLVGLLLPEKSNGTKATKLIDKAQFETEDNDDIKKAIDVIESLRVAELENYFQDPCFLEEQDEVDIDKLIDNIDKLIDDNKNSAIIYPIVLDEEENVRLVVLLKFPQKRINYHSKRIPKSEFNSNIEKLRNIIYIKSRNILDETINLQDRANKLRDNELTSEAELNPPLQQLYNWLIQPIETELKNLQGGTLVFIPDRELRNIPLAALHDGDEYLIEKYSIALLPGLKLTNTQPWSNKKNPKILLGGNEKQLPAVKKELDNIAMNFRNKVQLRTDNPTNNSTKKFTKKNLETELQSSFDIVHLATHGKFSPDLENTQIEIREIETEKGTEKEVIKFQEFEDLLQERNSDPIKLLVLSSCETSVGNDRAVLGLAGVAVRTGVSSTVATLWRVEDETATEVMSKFYQELSNEPDLTLAEALRRAQLNMLNNEFEYTREDKIIPYRPEHPIFWAGYVVVGNWL
ncbi:MAG: CHAT domain-containing protein [Symploca sp. SIO3E6]|nr:CHAT domain-containing protein [Caldora sp. SIO3E6]